MPIEKHLYEELSVKKDNLLEFCLAMPKNSLSDGEVAIQPDP